jgi:hypothetical protein
MIPKLFYAEYESPDAHVSSLNIREKLTNRKVFSFWCFRVLVFFAKLVSNFHQSQPLTQSFDVTHAVRVVKNVTCLGSLLSHRQKRQKKHSASGCQC